MVAFLDMWYVIYLQETTVNSHLRHPVLFCCASHSPDYLARHRRVRFHPHGLFQPTAWDGFE